MTRRSNVVGLPSASPLLSSATIILVSILATILFISRSAYSQDDLVRALHTRLRHTSSYQWSCEAQAYDREPIDWKKIPRDTDPLKTAHDQGIVSFQIAKGQKWSGTAIVESDISRFKFTYEYQGTKNVCSSNGSQLVTLSPTQTKTGKEGPSNVDITGGDDPANALETAMYCAGLDFVPFRVPQFFRCLGSSQSSVALGDFIEILEDPSIEKSFSRLDEKYSIAFPAYHDDGGYAGKVQYEFAVDGALEVVLWYAGEGWSPTKSLTFKNEISQIGISVPSSVDIIDWASGRRSLLGFSGWSVPADDAFEFEIPEGAYVTDHVNELVYKQIGDASKEARAAVLYALQNGLELPQPNRRASIVRYGMVIGILLLVFFMVYRKYKKGGILLLLLSASVWVGCTESNRPRTTTHEAVDADSVASWVPGIGWKLSDSHGQTRYISQCGYTASVLALELSGRLYDAMLVSHMLEPTRSGIRMSDIARTLSSHGLEVVARKNLEFQAVVQTLPRYDFAIVHVPQYQQRRYVEPHYVVMFKDSRGSIVYLDPPHAPIAVDLHNDKELETMIGLTALFCIRTEVGEPSWKCDSDLVHISPDEFVDGIFRGSLVLTNTGPDPIAIVKASSSCSCVQLDFLPLVIPEGKTVAVPYFVDQVKWGNSRQLITFSDAVGTSHSVSFEGSSAIPLVTDSIASKKTLQPPFALNKNVSIPMECGQGVFQLDINIPILRTLPVDCELETPQNCKLSIQSLRGQSSILGSLSISQDDIEKLSDGHNYRCTIGFLHNGLRLGQLSLNVYRECNFSQYLQEIDGTQSVRIFFEGCNEWEIGQFSLATVQALDPQRSSDGGWSIGLKLSEPLKNDVHMGSITFTHPEYLSVTRPFVLNLDASLPN